MNRGMVRQNSQTIARLRPVDLAREHGVSTQAVRNYEQEGILPQATRTPTGHRAYTRLHARALGTFLALIPGHGRPTASAVLRAVNAGAPDDAFRLLDASHAELLDDRATLHAVELALDGLGPDVTGDPVHRVAETFIGPLAAQLRIRPATLRAWEQAGIVRPVRDPRTGYRVYDEAAVRDARLAHQLRRGGYRLEQIAQVVAHLRAAGSRQALEAMLGDWHGRLSDRGRAMLSGAAALDAYLRALSAAAPPA